MISSVGENNFGEKYERIKISIYEAIECAS